MKRATISVYTKTMTNSDIIIKVGRSYFSYLFPSLYFVLLSLYSNDAQKNNQYAKNFEMNGYSVPNH